MTSVPRSEEDALKKGDGSQGGHRRGYRDGAGGNVYTDPTDYSSETLEFRGTLPRNLDGPLSLHLNKVNVAIYGADQQHVPWV